MSDLKNWAIIKSCADGTFERATPFETKESALLTYECLQKNMFQDEWEEGKYMLMESVD